MLYRTPLEKHMDQDFSAFCIPDNICYILYSERIIQTISINIRKFIERDTLK